MTTSQRALAALRARCSSTFDLGSDLLELVLELGELAAAGHEADEFLPIDLMLAIRAEAGGCT